VKRPCFSNEPTTGRRAVALLRGCGRALLVLVLLVACNAILAVLILAALWVLRAAGLVHF
jgi:hypothetical protein